MPKVSTVSRARNWLITPLTNAVTAQTSAVTAQTNGQQSQHDFLLRTLWEHLSTTHKNPLNHFGAKFFSQTDEDGITLEIIRRLDIDRGIFAEIGVGNGLENNSLILLAKGWRGFWVGGEDLAFDHSANPRRLIFMKAFVSLENVIPIMKRGLKDINTNELDILSLDVDGNDYYFAQAILKMGILPKLFILEYNAKFPPPIKWIIKYDADHMWDGTDYFGASLASFSELLTAFSYTLICCNAATGANAFFVRNEYLPRFADVPKNIDDIFVGPRYQLCRGWGHTPSPKTVERMLLTD
jgi:hypothetical protein